MNESDLQEEELFRQSQIYPPFIRSGIIRSSAVAADHVRMCVLV